MMKRNWLDAVLDRPWLVITICVVVIVLCSLWFGFVGGACEEKGGKLVRGVGGATVCVDSR